LSVISALKHGVRLLMRRPGFAAVTFVPALTRVDPLRALRSE
jgi:hypothetical protein